MEEYPCRKCICIFYCCRTCGKLNNDDEYMYKKVFQENICPDCGHLVKIYDKIKIGSIMACSVCHSRYGFYIDHNGKGFASRFLQGKDDRE